MTKRASYYKMNRPAIDALAAVGRQLTSIDPKLRALVELRVSQIDGCVFCVDRRPNKAREAGDFSENQIVDLTLITANMNAWNRIAIGHRTQPARR